MQRYNTSEYSRLVEGIVIHYTPGQEWIQRISACKSCCEIVSNFVG